MKTLRLVSFLLLLVTALIPLAVFAQGGAKTEWATYTSDDKKVSFNYPKDWIVQADKDVPFPAYWVANSADAMTRLSAPGDVPPKSGDVGLIFLLLPTDFLPALQVDVPADVKPGDLALAIVKAVTSSQNETEGVPTFGKPEEVPLTDKPDAITAGRVSVTRKTSDGVFTVFTLKEGILVVSEVATYTGELTQDMTDMGLAFSASITYDGTSQELVDAVNAMLTATPEATTEATPEGTPAATELAERTPEGTEPPQTTEVAPGDAVNGKALFESVGCATCHNVDTEADKVGPSLMGIGSEAAEGDIDGHPALDYLKQSIVDPGAVIVEGFQNVMPSFKDTLTDAQIQDIIAYLLTLTD